MRAAIDPGSPLSQRDTHERSPWWALQKGSDVVHCLVSEKTDGQAVICIELASGHSPVSIIQRCEQDALATAIEEWRRLFREFGWYDS
jgi:hypothetical protein